MTALLHLAQALGPFALLAAVLLVPWLLWALQARENRRAVLRRVLGRVDGRFVPGRPWSDVIEGRHAERPFRLTLSTRPAWRPIPRRPGDPTRVDVYPLEVSLALRDAPDVRLRIRRDAGLAALEKAVGLATDVDVSGGDAFDREYLVEVSGAPPGAALAEGPVRAAIDALLRRWALGEIQIEGGRLVVRGAPEMVGTRELHRLLDALEVLANAFDRRSAADLGLAGKFVWIGGGDRAARCPFCHDALDDPRELVACEGCRTLLHGECHAEHGGCPILGCGHQAAQRAPRGPSKVAPGGGPGGADGTDGGAAGLALRAAGEDLAPPGGGPRPTSARVRLRGPGEA